ncbi:MAG TPA: SDR family oxidoreductase [Xanthobacteraceae bacterium]|nr:SDR family oxidoreductase [Xanthobacteraceae bacterium]
MKRVEPSRDFHNRTVVVTGASAGVGCAVALRFARAGARIGLIARDAQALEGVRNEVERLGGSAIAAAADVADPGAVFAAAEQIRGAFGPIDVWVNDAMVTVFAPAWQISPEEFRRVTEVTYLGAVHGTLAALRDMRPRGRGTIIQIGSALAYRGIPLQAAYCGAKHAIRGFTDSLRSELIHTRSRIKISMVQLPAVNTPQFDWARTHMARQPRPVPPVIEPEVIAEAVFRTAQRPRREVWIGWSTIEVILGNLLLPAFLDRYVARHAFESQETADPVRPERQDNLFEPVHGLHRTRGRFSREAGRAAPAIAGPTVRVAPIAAGALALAAVAFFARGPARARPHRN